MIDPWLPTNRSQSSGALRLFCFPHAGAGAFLYHKWLRPLSDVLDLCPVQLPGRETRVSETPFTRMQPLIEVLAEALVPHMNTPFALFGHSFGALIAFELARRIRRKHDLMPVHLFVSSHRAPNLPDPNPPIFELPQSSFIEEVERYGRLPQPVLAHAELLEVLLSSLRGDFAVRDTYRYVEDDPLTCPVSVFGGCDDAMTGLEMLEAWGQHTSSSFRLKRLPGNHFYLESQALPLRNEIMADVSQYLGLPIG